MMARLLLLSHSMHNAQIAESLERCADLLEAQHADLHRVRAYRTAARSVRTFPGSVAALAREGGGDALDAIYGVGKSIATAIEQLVRTGRWAMLDRLQGEVPVEQMLLTLPGLGATLARRVHAQLGIETLEELELAAHDGRLAQVHGFGSRRIQMVREQLASRLAHRGRSALDARQVHFGPSVSALLAIDSRYRDDTDHGRLARIAPRRFNPTREFWLPILHTEVEGFQVHALFSNTALAHKLQRTQDWVVVHFERDGTTGQHTVVTESKGPLAGKRVIRGLESECAAYYAQSTLRCAPLSSASAP